MRELERAGLPVDAIRDDRNPEITDRALYVEAEAVGHDRDLGFLGLAGTSQGQAASDYKALVCVFLYGGVDGNNLVVPIDAAGYAQYTAVRTVASGVNLAQAALLPIQPASSPTPYGLHPDLSDIQPLFAQRKLAILANVGPLNEPTTKANYFTTRPDNLFSHSDQQNQWQSSVSAGVSRTGWGGRIADATAGLNASFPVVTSIAGTSLFMAGNSTSPLALPSSIATTRMWERQATSPRRRFRSRAS